MAKSIIQDLTDEELKDFQRRGFAHGGLESAMNDSLDEFVLLIRHHGFAALLEALELAEQDLSDPPT